MTHDRIIAAFQIDPIESLNPKTDTSLLMMREAQKRGFECFVYTPQHLGYYDGDIMAYGIFVTVDHNCIVINQSPYQKISLFKARYVFIRQNPPYDMSYITALDLLQLVAKSGSVTVLNNPQSLLLFKEKMIPLLFPDLIPKTCILHAKNDIHNFIDTKKNVVLKPLHGFAGSDVMLVNDCDVNRDAIVDLLLVNYPQGIIAQEFLKNVQHNERRLIFINGELKSVFKRIPKDGNIRSNTGAGGVPTKCDFSDDDFVAEDRLKPFLKESGFMLAGIDMIDRYLIEVNVTSPTGLRYAENLYGVYLEVDLWNAIQNELC